MRIAVIDESASRASVIREGLSQLDGSEVFVVTERQGLVAQIAEIAPDVVLIDPVSNGTSFRSAVSTFPTPG